MDFCKIFYILAVILAAHVPSILGLTLHGIEIRTVSLNGTLSCPYNENLKLTMQSYGVDQATVEIQCGITGTVISRARTDYMGHFDFFFTTERFPLFNPSSCDVVINLPVACCALPSTGLVRAYIIEETVAQTTDGAQAFFHASAFTWSIA
ncbi:uncharacterized protein LOC131250724 [Magnolia sinica]|uniref:uncharacterized protein LOC131250724 n=1 Tax=Magnolia sinica TaxID=86752 RepID=UPI00265B33A0|nr:uncharacterized protein LOC131250724 [Magnolia sinica]